MPEVRTEEELKLSPFNLYRKGFVLIEGDGTKELNREPVDYQGSELDEYYTVTSDDTLDRIAYNFYKNKIDNPEKYWWVIADANDIENPLDMEALVGVELLIPDILQFNLNHG